MVVEFNDVNVSGKWIKFLKYYGTIDPTWKDYSDGMEDYGGHPMFMSTLTNYSTMLNFNNQMDRLVVLIHLLGQTSIWTYTECP